MLYTVVRFQLSKQHMTSIFVLKTNCSESKFDLNLNLKLVQHHMSTYMYMVQLSLIDNSHIMYYEC